MQARRKYEVDTLFHENILEKEREWIEGEKEKLWEYVGKGCEEEVAVWVKNELSEVLEMYEKYCMAKEVYDLLDMNIIMVERYLEIIGERITGGKEVLSALEVLKEGGMEDKLAQDLIDLREKREKYIENIQKMIKKRGDCLYIWKKSRELINRVGRNAGNRAIMDFGKEEYEFGMKLIDNVMLKRLKLVIDYSKDKKE